MSPRWGPIQTQVAEAGENDWAPEAPYLSFSAYSISAMEQWGKWEATIASAFLSEGGGEKQLWQHGGRKQSGQVELVWNLPFVYGTRILKIHNPS